MIRVTNLVKKYGSITAVRDVSFEVKAGEIFAFLGPNGAGKTTTIKILTTLLRPTSGEVEVDGLNPSNKSERSAQTVWDRLSGSEPGRSINRVRKHGSTWRSLFCAEKAAESTNRRAFESVSALGSASRFSKEFLRRDAPAFGNGAGTAAYDQDYLSA